MTEILSALLVGGELLLPLAALALAGFALAPGTGRTPRPGARLVLLTTAGCLAAAVVGLAWLGRQL
ncbi:hypothetical protein DN069_27665 [Streptacidiphilus pinicola]|uniref:Uncharacterized protein n=1 Tax=Streptacidiphilus pinicola TaxID=2219663 RepID=A0A2X0IXB4_9ACTN|nr:hypothetical protein [Streptacidiphilus pinicola]RAG82446.1 hypothetical protein DN069_27665 [Streptacidiphilus pinicola]